MKTLLLVCMALAVQSFEDTRFIQFKEIDQDDFGKTLIDTLEISVQSGQSLDKVVDMLRDIETQVESEMQEDNANNADFQKKCDTDLSQLDIDINVVKLSITEQQSKLDELNNQHDKEVQIVSAKQQWFDQLNDQLQQQETLRKQEADTYEESMRENTYVIYVVQEVKKKFVEADGISFIQITHENSMELANGIYDDIENAVDESKNFRQNTGYRNVFEIFAQITARVKDRGNSDAINKLLDLCGQLMHSVEDNMSLLRRSEDKRQSIYEKQRKAMDKNRQTLEQDLAMTNSDLLSLGSKIDMSTTDIEDSKQRLNNKQVMKEDRRKECQTAAYSFKQSRDSNENKRQLVSQVIGLFSAQQRDFKDYMKVRRG